MCMKYDVQIANVFSLVEAFPLLLCHIWNIEPPVNIWLSLITERGQPWLGVWWMSAHTRWSPVHTAQWVSACYLNILRESPVLLCTEDM